VLIENFRIEIADEVLADLRERIARTRWPDAVEGAGWAYGTDPAYLRDLVTTWGTTFDWRARERELNRFAHFRADVDGLGVHFLHERGRGPDPMPLVLTHGWPSTFVEHLDLVPLLTDPAAHGGDAADAFDVVVTSLPGYGFSDRPSTPGMTKAAIADRWVRLIRDGLGYQRFGAHGSDIGAGVTVALGRRHPESLIGLHLSAYTFPAPPEPWTPAERAFVEAQEHWWRTEGGYSDQQSTKPQTLAYGLTDSPAGLAAWIVEKFRAWSDCGGDVESRFARDQLLTNLTIYWATATINASTRVYYEERRAEPSSARVPVPAGFAVFANEFVPEGTPPRELAERTFDVRRWSEQPRGGHFAALEEPAALAEEIRAFFRPLRG